MGLSFTVVALVLSSCGLHALWNLLLKRAVDKAAFTACFLLATPVLFLPVPLLFHSRLDISPLGWVCIAATGVLYAIYFAALAAAYEGGELSVIYPVARGLGPALALVWAALFLGEHPSPLGVLGVALVVGAAVALMYRPEAGRAPAKTRTSRKSLAFALVVGLCTSAYSLVDKVGVARARVHPALYLYLAYLVTVLLFSGWLAVRGRAGTLASEWRRSWRTCLGVAALNLLAYMLVLHAMTLPGSPVSYVVPLRSASIVIAVLLGVEVLGEGSRWLKLGAGLLTMLGIALMAWKG